MQKNKLDNCGKQQKKLRNNAKHPGETMGKKRIKKLEAKRGHKVVYTWLTSYVVLLLVMILMWIGMMRIAQRFVLRQSYSISENTLEVLVKAIDDKLTTVGQISSALLIDDKVIWKNKNQFTQNGKGAYTNMQIRETLESYRFQNPYIQDILLYLPQSDSVISTTTACSADIYYEINLSGTDLSREAWKALMEETHSEDYIFLKKGESYSTILYIRTVPVIAVLKKGGSGYSNAVFSISVSSIQEIVDEFSSGNGMFLTVYNQDGNPVIQSGNASASASGKRLFRVSSVNGWYYEAFISNAVLNRDVYRLVLLMAGILTAALIGFAAISLYCLKRNYNPLFDLLEYVRQTRGKEVTNGSEYLYIRSCFDEIVENQREEEKQLESQMESIRASYVCRLLAGNLQRTDIAEEIFENLHLSWVLQPCFILITKPAAENTLGKYNLPTAEQNRMLRIGRENGDILKGYTVVMNHTLVSIVRFDGTEEEQRELLNRYRMEVDPDQEWLMAVSGLFTASQNIEQAYEEASCTMQYMEYASSCALMTYSEVRKEVGERKYHFISEQVLEECLKSGQQERVREQMLFVWDENMSGRFVSLKSARFYLIVHLNTLFKVILAIQPDFFSEGLPTERLAASQMRSMEELRANLVAITDSTLASFGESVSAEKRDPLADAMIQFIDGQLSDPDLSVEQVAEAMNRSVSYVSKVFRNAFGEGMLNYINRRRIQKAKLMIEASDGKCGISEIGAAVGCVNPNTFIRLFKKYTGMTPGKYREMTAAEAANRDTELAEEPDLDINDKK